MDGVCLSGRVEESSKNISTKSRQLDRSHDSHEVWVHCGTMRAKSQPWADCGVDIELIVVKMKH